MGLFTDRFRAIIVLIAFCCLTIINSNYITMNFTFICMKYDMSDGSRESENRTISIYDYNTKEKSFVIWAVGAGTIVGTFPVNWSYIKFGARIPFLIAGVLSLISTALIPLAAKLSFNGLLALRFIQGVAYSADFAAIGILCVRWAPLNEYGTFIGVLTSFTSLSSFLTNMVTGKLCTSSFGWKSTFYLHSIVCVIVFTVWFFLYRDDPPSHPCMGEKELKTIQKGKSAAHIEGDSYVPYRDILTNRVILTVWLNAFTEMNTSILLITFAPTYFHSALGFSVEDTGMISSLIMIPMPPTRLLAGFLSDKQKGWSEHTKMIVYNGVAVGLAGVMCILIGLAGHSLNGAAAIILFTLTFVCTSANSGGFYKCATYVARQHAHFVLATIQFMKCVALVVAPLMVNAFVKDEGSTSDWMSVFIINGIMLIVSHIVFWIVCTDKPAEFTAKTRNEKETELSLQEKQPEEGKAHL